MSGKRQPEGEPPPPVVQRLRIRYAKRGRLRFTSHRDFARALERAIRRARVPIAYSAGFSPHPKVSYVGACPTGVASEAEYLEIGLAEAVEPERLLAALDESLPAGLDLVEVVEAQGGSLPERIDASRWEIDLPAVTHATLTAAVARFMALSEVPVQRLTKSGSRPVDARAAVVLADTRPSGGGSGEECATLTVVVRHVTPAVRPDDILTGLQSVADLELPEPPRATRLAQGLLDATGQIADPLQADRKQTSRPGR
ncbi:MAG: TIGR03936 family radical SAM-associated protein [Mycobacteriales bacterium]